MTPLSDPRVYGDNGTRASADPIKRVPPRQPYASGGQVAVVAAVPGVARGLVVYVNCGIDGGDFGRAAGP